MNRTAHEPNDQQHGDVFGRGSGNMFIHVQRANGLAHRTLVLRPWQVQTLRLIISRWFAVAITVVALSWGYLAVQTARVPLLIRRIASLERNASKIDTLQATLEQVQKRYDQVQQMLSASSRAAPVRTAPAVAPVGSANPAKRAAVADTLQKKAAPADSVKQKAAPVKKPSANTN